MLSQTVGSDVQGIQVSGCLTWEVEGDLDGRDPGDLCMIFVKVLAFVLDGGLADKCYIIEK